MCRASRVSAVVALVCLLLASSSCRKENPVVIMETSEGTVRIELFAEEAPETVANFLRYVDDGFYDGTVFHRVIANFMVQGGGFTPEMKQKETQPAIANEAANGLRNLRGTFAMAWTGDPHSATAQFFINVVDNAFLDHTAPTEANYGYCVFAKVTEGLDVVDRIKAVETRTVGPFENVPATPVVINSIRRAETP